MGTIFINQLEEWIRNNMLVCVKLLNGNGGASAVYGRVVGYEELSSLLVYIDDNKQVANLSFNQIDDIQAV